jgi:zinc protease
MKRIALTAAAALSLLAGCYAQLTPAPPPQGRVIGTIDRSVPSGANILPYPIVRKTLPNGLNVATVKFDSPGIAAFYIVVRVGSRNEIEEGKTGFAHFFEHMMFRGTDRYSKDEYDKVLKSLGASANANTSLDRTIYHMTGNAEKLETMFDIEADRFMNLNYSLADFKAEAGAVKGEYTKNNSSPYSQLYEQLLGTAFEKHTYRHTTMGFFSDIVDMPNQFEYSREFFRRYYRPEYTTLLVVGDVKPEQVNALAQKYFGKWERGTYAPAIPAEPEQQQTRYTHLKNGSIPPFLWLSYKGPAFSDVDADFPALDVLSSILFSERSALYRKLVIEEQKVRSLSGGTIDSRDPGLFTVDASLVSADDMQYVKDELVKALEKAKTVPVAPEILQDTKSFLKYSFAMRIDSPDAIANSLAHYVSLSGDPESLNRLYRMYEQVTAEDLMRVARKYITDTRLTVATISDKESGGVK